MHAKLLILVLSGLLVFLTGCDDAQTVATNNYHQNIAIENVAWMRDKLPDNTLAYARVPSLWEVFFEDKADGLHSVQSLPAHMKIINDIRNGFVSSYLSKIPKSGQVPFEILIKNMSTPLEFAILNAEDNSMIPELLIGSTLKGSTYQQLNAVIEAIKENIGGKMKIISLITDSSVAHFSLAEISAFVSFDNKTGQLLILSGVTANEKRLLKIRNRTHYATDLKKIMAYENAIAPSGKNFETWLNIEGILRSKKQLIPPSEMAMVKKLGLDRVEYLWAGTGSSSGKSELILKLAMPEVGLRHFIPAVDSEFRIKTAGVPRSAWQITRPTVEQFIKGFEFALSFTSNPDSIRNKANEILKTINDNLGISVADILKIYGRKLLIVTDDSGTWFASKILDIKAHKHLIETFMAQFILKNETKSLAGVDIHVVKSSSNKFTKKLLKELGIPTADIPFLNIKQKSYYTIENDSYIQAFVPQVLADRENDKNKQDFSQWLKKQQGQNWTNALLAYTTQVQDAPRSIYYVYLKVLELLGNFSNTEVNLFTLPTAQQLHLPKQGQFSFAFDADTEGFSLKLSYQYSIFENMSYFDSYVALVYIGIVAAVAVPAFNDYTTRAKVSEKYYRLSNLSDAIGNYYDNNKAFPTKDFLFENFTRDSNFEFDSETGILKIIIPEQEGISFREDYLKLTPVIEADDIVQWKCTSSLKQKYLPRYCFQTN